MARVTISLPDEMREEIEEQVQGTDSLSGWFRDAAREHLEDGERKTVEDAA